MQVNLLGHALLAAELLPLLNRSGFVRVAAQSSGARFNAREADLRADLGSSIMVPMVQLGGTHNVL